MVTKPLPVSQSGLPLFSPLPTIHPSSPTSQALAKEAKQTSNAEKGYAADEKYLGEQQNLEQKAQWFKKEGQLGAYDFDDLAEMGLDEFYDIGDK